jgi:hypothetical protein
MRAAANGGIALLFQSPRLVSAVAELGSLGIPLLRNRGVAAKDIQTNDEARMTKDEAPAFA